MKTHRHKCVHCGKSFACRRNFMDLLTSHQCAVERRGICDECYRDIVGEGPEKSCVVLGNGSRVYAPGRSRQDLTSAGIGSRVFKPKALK